MASSATVSAPKKRKSFSEYFHSMRGQQLIVTLVFLFVPLVLLFMYNIDPRHMMLLAILLLGAVVIEDAAPAAVWLPSVICALL